MKKSGMRLSGKDKFGLVSNLATMFSAGIPLLESVESLLDGAKGNQKKLLETIRADLTQGKHLYAALAEYPLIFDVVTVNIIKASEEAGTLDVALRDLKSYIKKDAEFSDKLKSAMIYPVFIIGVFIAVFLMILVVVVPKISTVFDRLRVDLPLPTKILIFLSQTLLTYTIPVILGTSIVVGLCIFLFRRYRRTIINAIFSLPLLSGLAKEIDLMKFTHSLYLLLGAGLPITTALQLSTDVVMKKDIAQAMNHARESVIAGKKLSEGFEQSRGLIPMIMIKITAAGEKSGSLDKSMQEISEYLDYEVSNSLKTIIALLEPIMLVVVGVLIGGMMLAIIAPIYGLIGQVSVR